MFRWPRALAAVLPLALLLAGAPARAQNQTCPTPPSGDNSNRCASTAFVRAAVSTPSLPQNQIFVGQASGLAGAVPMSQDCVIVASGVITCTATNGVSFSALATAATGATLSVTAATLQTGAATGDVTWVANSFATTIAANAVTYAKFQQVSASRLLGNPTGSLANAGEIALGSTLSFSLSALQTGAGTGDVTWSANSFATTIAANAVSYAKFQQVAASSLVGNPAGSPANAQAISLGNALTFSGSALQTVAMSGDVTSSANSFATTIAANAVTYAKLQQVAAASLVGNPTGSLANAQGVTLGATLSFSGTALQTGAMTGDVTSSANSFATTIAANAVTNAKAAQMAANTVKANPSGALANAQDVAPATARSSSLLNIDAVTTFTDANYAASATDRTIATTATAFTAQRTVSLAAISSYNPGQMVVVVDAGGAINGANTLVIAANGTDTINGVASITISAQYGGAVLWPIGANKWGYIASASGGGSGTVTDVIISAGTGVSTSGNCNITVSGTCVVGLSTPVATANGGTGVSSPTAHTIPINEGSSAQNNTGTGSVGQFVASNGASADPSMVSGPWTLLATLTASNSASLSDTTHITSAYSDYMIVFENLIPSTSSVALELLVHSGGAFQTTSYYGQEGHVTGSGGSQTAFTTYIPLSAGANVTTTIANVGDSGSIMVANPSQSSAPKSWWGQYLHGYAGPAVVLGTCGGLWNGNGAIDGFEVLFSSGNIVSGTIKIYGRN